mmetsp:Transcript_44458/g.144314  ORF Transcript_44458/g.144314 Transcript_44458/m.144314 type:complete len:237 (+) Transcript_44458:557-1267(+)
MWPPAALLSRAKTSGGASPSMSKSALAAPSASSTFWSPAMQSMTAMPRSTPILRRSSRMDIQVDAASFHVSLFTSSASSFTSVSYLLSRYVSSLSSTLSWIGLRRRASRSMSKLPWKPPALTSYFVAALRTDLTTRLLMLPLPPSNLNTFFFDADPNVSNLCAITVSICSASLTCSEPSLLSFSRDAPQRPSRNLDTSLPIPSSISTVSRCFSRRLAIAVKSLSPSSTSSTCNDSV